MRAAGYLRVSTVEQVDGYSLDAQERAIREACEKRGYELLQPMYRDEGVSGKSDRIDKRPALARLLKDAKNGAFDVVIVHTLDRWARNLRVALESVSKLGEAGVGFVSLSENTDYSTPEGRFQLQTLAAIAEYFSGNLAKHVRKARRERFELGLSNGSPPFGYTYCVCEDRNARGHSASCSGVVVVESEAEAIRNVAQRYAASLATLEECAAELNTLGFQTRQGRRFSSSSVRFLIQNAYLAGNVTYRDASTKTELMHLGKHPAILSMSVYNQIMDRKGVRAAAKRRVGRGYLLKGIATCVHCGTALWGETHRRGYSYYRHPRGNNSDPCPAAGRSVQAQPIDAQAGKLVMALCLPRDWKRSVERRVASYDRIRTVEQQRAALVEKRRRITNAYTLGNLEDDEYSRESQDIKTKLSELRIPEVEQAIVAGHFLDNMAEVWASASQDERHDMLRSAVVRLYVDGTGGRLVGVTPRPAFWTVFEQVRVKNPTVLLLKPDEVKQRLAEQRAAEVGLVETGEN